MTLTHSQYEDRLFHSEIDYFPNEEYQGMNIPIQHECLKNHKWLARPRKILEGTGCPYCVKHGRTKTHPEYIEQLIDRGIKNYPLETYIKDNIKILHKCINNHTWNITPNDILKGNGCPHCCIYSFSRTKPAILYFISFTVEEITYYKLGITNKSVKNRFKTETIKPNIEWIKYFNRGQEAELLEKELLNKYSKYKINTGALRRGNTETLSIYIPCV